MKRWLFHWHVSGWGRGPPMYKCYQIDELMIQYYHLIWLFRMFCWHDLTLIGNSSRFAMKVLKPHAKWAGIMVNWFLMVNWFAPHPTAPAHAGTVITAFFTSALRNLEASLCNFLAMASGFRDLTLKPCICNPWKDGIHPNPHNFKMPAKHKRALWYHDFWPPHQIWGYVISLIKWGGHPKILRNPKLKPKKFPQHQSF